MPVHTPEGLIWLVLCAWMLLSCVVALWLGRAFRLADQRQTERYNELDVDLTKVEDQLTKLVAARSATTLIPVVRPLPESKAARPTHSTGKHARRD